MILKALLIIAVLPLLIGIPLAASAERGLYDPPLRQQGAGAQLHDIVCNEPLELYLRSTQEPLCISQAGYDLLSGNGLYLEPAAGSPNVDSYKAVSSQNARQTVADAIAVYDEGYGQDGLDSLAGSHAEQLYYPYVLNADLEIVATGGDGTQDMLLSGTQSSGQILELLQAGSDVWVEHSSVNPVNGDTESKRSLLSLHDDYVFGSGYYLGAHPDGDLRTVKIGSLAPALDRVDGAGVVRMLTTAMAENDFNRYLQENGADWRLDVTIRHTHPGTDEPVDAIMAFYDDGISVLTGPSASSSVERIKPFADKNGMTIISCCSTSPKLAIEGDSVFRLAPDDTKQGPVIAGLMVDDGRSILIPVWRDDVWGTGLHSSTVESFESLGGTVDSLAGSYSVCEEDGCYDEPFSAMASALDSAVRQYVEGGEYSADDIGIAVVGFTETAELMEMAADYEILSEVRWFGSDAVARSSSAVSENVIEFAEAAQFTATIFAVDPTTDPYLHVLTMLSHHTDLKPNVYAYASYDAVWTAGLAIEAAGGDGDTAMVREQLPLVLEDYTPASGPLYLNSAGDSDRAAYDVWIVLDSSWVHLGVYSVSE